MNKFIILTALVLWGSCKPETKLAKGSTVYQFTPGAGGNVVNKVTVNNNPNVSVEERTGHLVITFLSTPATASVQLPAKPPIGFSSTMASSNEYYFYEPQDNGSVGGPVPKNLVYYSSNFQIQAISVPFKFRPAVRNNPRILDSLPAQTETGFTLGFAAGTKYTKNTFSLNKNILGSYVNKVSIYPGGFLSFGTTALTRLKTYGSVNFDRNVPLISIGGFIMFGFNNINIGYTIGIDNPISKYGSNWVYKGRIWQGLTIGLDLVR